MRPLDGQTCCRTRACQTERADRSRLLRRRFGMRHVSNVTPPTGVVPILPRHFLADDCQARHDRIGVLETDGAPLTESNVRDNLHPISILPPCCLVVPTSFGLSSCWRLGIRIVPALQMPPGRSWPQYWHDEFVSFGKWPMTPTTVARFQRRQPNPNLRRQCRATHLFSRRFWLPGFIELLRVPHEPTIAAGKRGSSSEFSAQSAVSTPDKLGGASNSPNSGISICSSPHSSVVPTGLRMGSKGETT